MSLVAILAVAAQQECSSERVTATPKIAMKMQTARGSLPGSPVWSLI